MSDQWEKYVEPAAVAMNGGHQRHAVDRWGPEVRTVLEAVGPLIAEDTRERLVAAAARAVERETPSMYYCPASGEIEQKPGGGFDQCCDRMNEHQPTSPETFNAVRKAAAEEIARAIEEASAAIYYGDRHALHEAVEVARRVGSEVKP